LGQGEFDYVAEDYGGTVGGDFYDVVGRVGVGLGEVGDYDLVDAGGSFGRVISSDALLRWTAGRGCPYVSLGGFD
jgi:hypothetical protein